MKRRPGLIVTGLAILFLLLDGVLLGWVGLAFGNALLTTLGAGFLFSALMVVVFYRRYLRSLEELRTAQAMLKMEMENMLQAVKEGGDRADAGMPSEG